MGQPELDWNLPMFKDKRNTRESITYRSDALSQKLYLIISGVIFLLVGVFHLLRLVYNWPIVVGTRIVPYALSYVGSPVSIGYFAWACWLLFRKECVPFGGRSIPYD